MTHRPTIFHASPLLLVTAVAVLAGACGGDKKDANSPTGAGSASAAYNQPPPGGYPPGTLPPNNNGAAPPPNNGYPPPNNGYPPPNNGGAAPPPNNGGAAPPTTGAAPATSASAGLPGFPIDPNLLAQIGAAGQALMGGGTVAAGDPVDLGIKAASLTAAPGMQPDGAAVKDTLAADGHKAVLVTLQGGKCYTFVAFSPPGQVTNVDLHLLMPPFYNLEAGHDDNNTNTAVIGRGASPLCPVTPFPVQYKLDVHAKGGQGLIGVQMYSKSK